MAEAMILGGALSAFMQVLAANVDSILKEEFKLLGSVKKEMEELKRIFTIVQELLEDAEERYPKDKVSAWIEELKDVAYDAEDMLDGFAMHSLRWKVDGDGSKGKPKQVSNWLSSFSSRTIFHRNIAIKLKRIRETFDRTLDVRHKFGLRSSESTSQSQNTTWRQTSSLPEENVVGRDEATNQIVEKLMLSESGRESQKTSNVLAIIGIGGVGKTTLAQLVYNDQRVKSHFQIRMWVCVYHDFDVVRLTREIIESATKEKPIAQNFDNLQEHLKNIVREGRFLIVLDDVWNTDMSRWENLRKPLLHGAQGSRVLVTTRSHEVANIMGAKDRFPLGGLPDGIYRMFFEGCAFGGESIAGRHPRLREISRMIAVRLGGSPLAAKTLGRLLNNNLDVGHWEWIEASELWELQQGETDILPILMLSYQHLSPPLKRCFAFCSVFPKGHMINRNSLIQMWMAHNFIRGVAMEEIANRYFDDLVQTCFFQKHFPGNETYKMHDLIHDLSQSVSVKECGLICNENHLHSISSKIRHMSCLINPEKAFKRTSKYKNLRSLLYLKIPSSSDAILHNVFLHSHSLRVLDLSMCTLERLPDSIGSLVHLCYLDLSNNGFSSLPESLGRLGRLQTLKLVECLRLSRLPKSISNLINLRTLDVDRSSNISVRIAEIGRLTRLRGLKEFRISREKGFRIDELKDLMELRGPLELWNLKEVDGDKEAASAGMRKKPHLDILTLGWPENKLAFDLHSNRDAAIDDGILEGLQPHPNLRELKIMDYSGIRSPSWLGNGACSNLQSLTLSDCSRWEVLPPIGQLPFLKSLKLNGLVGVEKIDRQFYGCNDNDRGFPFLEVIEVIDMPNLKEWEPGGEQGSWFPRLVKLKIDACPILKALPPLGQLSCLQELKILNCLVIDCIPENSLPASLEDLLIERCNNLEELPPHINVLGSLECLAISECPKIVSMPRLPQSLKELSVQNCTLLVERCQGPDWPNIAHVPHRNI